MSDEEHKDFSEQDVEQRFEAIGKTMVEQALYAEAIEAYKELLRDYPDSRWAANAYLAIAQCYHALGQEEDELAALEDIIRQFPEDVAAKRARGTVAALRARRAAEGGAGADVHGALRRLMRQVERMREGQARRASASLVLYVALILFVVFYVRGAVRSQDASVTDLGKRVAALESAVQALSGGRVRAPAPSPVHPPAGKPGPKATVIPLPAPHPESAKQPAPATPKPAPKPPVQRPAPTPEPTVKPTPATTPKPVRPAVKPSPAPAPPKSVATSTYTVKEGDSLWSIAKTQLGDAQKASEIARLNGLGSADTIKVGTRLRLPPKQ